MATQHKYEIPGKAVVVNQGGGFAFIKPTKDLPEGVTTHSKGGLHLRLQQNGPIPKIGDTGVFVIVPGDGRGWRVQSVVRWDQPSAASGQETQKSSGDSAGNSPTFIHPYNFVRFPDKESLARALKIAPFRREPSPQHDCLDSSRKSGYVDCQLTTKTDWFIPDPRKVHESDKHTTLGYFTLDDVNSWDGHRAPHADGTAPAIPGSSLRGMIGSVFELATLSCMRVFDAGSLDLRIGYGPDYDGENVGSPEQKPAEYIPVRITNVAQDGSAEVQFLEGCYAGDPHTAISVGLLNCYKDKVTSGAGPTDDLASILDVPDGSAIAVRLRSTLKRHHKGFQYRTVGDPLLLFRKNEGPKNETEFEEMAVRLAGWAAAVPETDDRFIIFGYLHRTGPNFPSKHYERIFFRAQTPYNDRSAKGYLAELPQRLHAFLADVGRDAVAAADVVDTAMDALRCYAERHGKDLGGAIVDAPRVPQRNRRSPPPYQKRPLPSDFVVRSPDLVAIHPGDLFYALCATDASGVREIRNLYPIAIPRITYENSRGELLPEALYPCARRHERCPQCRKRLQEQPYGNRTLCDACRDAEQSLCPACRVFGWTRDLTKVRGLAPSSNRVDRWAGHVRFTHGVLEGQWQQAGTPRSTRRTLPILNSPKPTTTGFYLHPLPDWENAREERWPPVLKHVSDKGQSVPGYGTPAYRCSEAQLSGRKQYRRRETADSRGANPGKMNQTVDVLPADLTFSFRVHFDNLSAEELGALLFALSLRIPESWKLDGRKNMRLFHTLGHGKPLGMGRCSIAVTSVCVDGPERYAAAGFGTAASGSPLMDTDIQHGCTSKRQLSSSGSPSKDDDIQPFYAAWDQLAREPELVRLREQMLDMLAVLPGDEPVQYPPVPIDDRGRADFRWWTAAKKSGVTLPDPVDERSDPGKRLPR